jgi:thymidylate synthase (FAD)
VEHAVWGLLLEGISRSLTHELVRHRAGMSYSQLSQRYVDESEVGFVRPPAIAPGSVEDTLFLRGVEQASENYRLLLEAMLARVADSPMPRTMRLKWARESARSLLPNATETKIVVTGNARSWRHFLALRGNPGADREVRRLAIAVHAVLQQEAPNIFGDVQVIVAEDGFPALQIGYPHV